MPLTMLRLLLCAVTAAEIMDARSVAEMSSSDAMSQAELLVGYWALRGGGVRMGGEAQDLAFPGGDIPGQYAAPGA